jgi:hypothetical protein
MLVTYECDKLLCIRRPLVGDVIQYHFALVLKYGIVSIASNRYLCWAGSLMYVSMRGEYVSEQMFS